MSELLITAREVLDKSANYEQARKKLYKVILKSASLKKEAIEFASHEAIREVSRRQRLDAMSKSEYQLEAIAAVQSGAKGPIPSKIASIAGLQELGNMFLFGGQVRLRDATKIDLLNSATAYEKQGAANYYKARYLRSIAKLIKGDRRVGQILSEERLRKIQINVDKVMAA